MKKRFKINDLGLMIFLFLSALLIIHKSLIVNQVSALESSPSSDIKTKLEEFKKEIASKAAALKEKVNEKLQNKAYAGVVKEVSGEIITIIDKSGEQKVKVNQDTVYANNIKASQKYAFKYIEKEDYIAALGEVDDLNNLVAKKVILLSDSFARKRVVVWGKLTSLLADTATIKDRDSNNISVSFSKVETDAEIGNFVIATGFEGKEKQISADFVFVIAQGGVLKPKKIATPSATPKTTPITKKK